ncbi:MAG: formate dehydrogenase accessory protein FdhE [Gemmatimonadaceae bacterium]|nr:formate dehydrogenase accessory protein FdhE [Gemmatimonadaceae bacterium]
MNRLLPDDLQLLLEAELAALKSLDDAEDVAPDYLRFCEEVARYHVHGRAAIRAARGASLGPDTARDGDPSLRRLTPAAIAYDVPLLQRLLHELQALARPSAVEDDPLSRIAAASASDAAVLTEIAEACARGDASGEGLERVGAHIGVSPAALAFVGRMLASPFVAEARHRRGELPEFDAREMEASDAVRCPCCGASPSLAALDASDGRRHLICSLCGETWIAPRVACPFCATRAGIATLRSSADAPRWIETCDTCGRYLKTIDLRRLSEPYVVRPIVELAATAHLDVMAEEAGYSSLPRERSTSSHLH